MADSKLTVQTADALAPITAQCDAIGAASDSRKVNNLASAAEQESLAKKLAARGVQETIGLGKVTQAMLDGGAVDGADGSSPAKKAKTEKDFESMYYDLLLEVKVLVRWSLDLKGLPGADKYFSERVAPQLARDSAGINFNGHASRRAPHCSFSHRFSSTTSRRTTARARRRPARTRSLKRVATPPPSHMCARRL